MQIAAQLTVLGWSVTVLTSQDYAPLAEIEAFNDAQAFRVVRLRRFPGPPLEAAYRYQVSSRIIRDWRPDVILASGERSVWIAARLARAYRLPWVAVGHGTEFGTKRRWERALNRSSFAKATAIVCVSEHTRARMRAAGVEGRREYVIANGADPEVFKPLPILARSTVGSAVLLTVGNVTERKGQEIIIRALPALPGVKYEMIGLPTRARELKNLAAELGVSDRVSFLGRTTQDELVRHLCECDLFVMTSRSTADGDFEGYGIAVVEAALCGKPAVVSSGSGLAEAIVAGETGLLAREGDVAHTASTIAELLDNPERRRRMGEAARLRALGEQTWAHRVQRYDAVLRECLRAPGRKIIVVSDTPHYRRGNTIVGWGPTVRELDQLSSLFDELVHVAPVNGDAAPASALPYESSRIRVKPLRVSGGERLVDKFGVIARAPGYVRALLAEIGDAEVVHLRCPAGVSMIAAFILPLLRVPKKRWIKYAGNWRPHADEPVSYEIQRWWLSRGWHRALVTVNGTWPDQPAHVRAFLNPCLTDRELAEGRSVAAAKSFGYPVRLLFVGRLEDAKGVHRALEVLIRLSRRGLAVRLDLVGDGPARGELERRASAAGVRSLVAMHGWQPRGAISALYASAHLMLFPSSASEGWPKVLSEAMAFGVVPVASRISSIPEYLLRFDIGTVADPHDVNGFVDCVLTYINDPERWRRESIRASVAAEDFTYPNYLQRVASLLNMDGASGAPQR
jgi:phosphatidylinositol alpha-1,6-mannosyltransferase